MYIGIKFKHCCYNYFNLSKFSTKTSSNFYEFYSAHKYIDPNWLTWFIGFTEGDGGLHCYKYSKSCLFGLTQKEEPILQEIKSVLGFGKVYFDISAKVYRYRVTTKNENLKLAILFNGKFATINKINQLKLWIDVLNADSVKLTFNPNPFLPSLNDSWLSGFTTADGSFFVSVLKQKYKKEVIDSEGNLGIKETISQLVRIKFVLDQKEEPILLHIKNIFGVGNVKKTTDIGVFRYNLGSVKSNSITVDYFLAYPLKGKKQTAFLKWKSIREMLLEKKHLKAGGIELIREKAKSINNF
jgi:LAGLIDADG endonuclease